MTEMTDQGASSGDDADWLLADDPIPSEDALESSPGRERGGRRAALAAAGLVAAGALVGGVGITALHARTSNDVAAIPNGFSQGQQPFAGGQGQLGQGQGQLGAPPQGLPGQGFAGPDGDPSGDGGFGGVDGEQRTSGTVTKVGASSVTLRTASGTGTYAVTAQTEIVRNGGAASLSDVRAGDAVFVHLIPGSGSSYVVERLFAQSGSASPAGADGASGTTT